MTLHHDDLIGCDTCYQVCHAKRFQTCPRCGEILHNRKPNSLARSWALTIAAAIFYVPSNIYPVMKVSNLGNVHTYTIYGGLKELANVGLWPLAALVFTASIAIPVFKLLMLAYMLMQTRRHSAHHLLNRTRLYRVLDFIGRWSMVDIFMVSILVALVRFGWMTRLPPISGRFVLRAWLFSTLLAVKTFDPRLMWDAAAKAAARSVPSSVNSPHDRFPLASSPDC